MVLKKFFDPNIKRRPMRVACFMSGSGTNVIKIIEHQIQSIKEVDKVKSYPKKVKNSTDFFHKGAPFEVVFLFSDRTDFNKCKVEKISKKYKIPFKANDIREYYKTRGYKDRRNMKVRREFDSETLEYLKEYDIDCVALGGYMSIVTEVIFNNHPTINVHPADLTILNEKGKRKYTGEHTVRDAIIAGETYIASSTHLATAEVDGGPLLLISERLTIELPSGITLDLLKKQENEELLEKIADSYQNKLKEKGDWVIFPKTLELMAKGLIEFDENNKIYVNGTLAPLRL
ncbi:MAG: phosphoribosylglycinamide formyltransferase [Candidatus Helarchaeota archaeon]